MPDTATCEVCGYVTPWDAGGPSRMERHFAEAHPDVKSHHHAGVVGE